MNDNAPESERWVPVNVPDRLKPLPDKAYLLALFRYDAATGLLYWRERPASMFASTRDARSWNRRFVGKEAFTARTNHGYRVGTIFNERLFAHRVIWKMLHGSDPKIIDHLNGDRSDNTPSNLSSGSASDNLRNKSRSRTNKSGVTGVYWNVAARKWLAQIRVDGISQSRTFASLEDAAAWRADMAAQRGFSKRHGVEGTAYCSPAFDRARREAEAVIADRFKQNS